TYSLAAFSDYCRLKLINFSIHGSGLIGPEFKTHAGINSSVAGAIWNTELLCRGDGHFSDVVATAHICHNGINLLFLFLPLISNARLAADDDTFRSGAHTRIDYDVRHRGCI